MKIKTVKDLTLLLKIQKQLLLSDSDCITLKRRVLECKSETAYNEYNEYALGKITEIWDQEGYDSDD